MMLLISAILRHLYLIATFRHDASGLHLQPRPFVIFVITITLAKSAVAMASAPYDFAESIMRNGIANGVVCLLWSLIGFERRKQVACLIGMFIAGTALAVLEPKLGSYAVIVSLSYLATMLISMMVRDLRASRTGNPEG